MPRAPSLAISPPDPAATSDAETWVPDSEERLILREEFTSRMHQRFLDGRDGDFDYRCLRGRTTYFLGVHGRSMGGRQACQGLWASSLPPGELGVNVFVGVNKGGLGVSHARVPPGPQCPPPPDLASG